MTLHDCMLTGRRLAELEINIALAHVMNNFRLEYPDKEAHGLYPQLSAHSRTTA